MTRHLILEWIGRWALPDHAHGGIDPGPYISERSAKASIEQYARRQADGWLGQGVDDAFIEREYRLCLGRHCSIEAPWPEDLKE